MKNQNGYNRTITKAVVFGLGLLSLSLSSANAQSTADPSIVGLWHTHFFLDNGTEFFQSFKQWHSDGVEFEIANVNAIPDSCQGTFKVRADGTVELLHVGWLFDQKGQAGYFRETETIRVSPDAEHYSGTWHEKDFDVNGYLISEEGGTVRARRLAVH